MRKFWEEGVNHQCQICGNDLIQQYEHVSERCLICGGVFDNYYHCPKGHPVCEKCSSLSFEDFAESYMINQTCEDPIEILEGLLQSPKLPIHGDSHLFLVTATLLCCYYNRKKDFDAKKRKIRQAKMSALKVVEGAFEGLGFSATAVASSLFIRLITATNEQPGGDRHLSNIILAGTLTAIAQYAAPKCAKRESYESVMEVLNFIRKNFEIIFTHHGVLCKFSGVIPECMGNKCPYYAVKHGEDII